MTEHNSWIQAQLGPLKSELLAYAKSNGLTLSEAVRIALINLVRAEGPPRFTFEPGLSEKVSKTCATYLTASEYAAISAAAQAVGLSEARWLHWLIRAHLTGEPHFGQFELEALTSSNLTLLKLNRTLRSLSSKDVAQQVEDVSCEIARHTYVVAELVRANQMRWALRG
ncbi:hypothetical protein [Asticcacaulis excentricus]|uniref:Uncharacterized protein n=1 Tax=Asticcacaulis excentricus (strain ATCC 15261 / DSM 4724 / KCTC 12464 / NCIMB 9791 / VKM B-1370 / CB 48) TaxID=573065 RepID=E8RMR7_ASTEC|nr:hypothetical protein [Asticcacaulis excentricus]ADU13948.1 hypothetical protein Astex_2294 [Asticcacaulis excentricus CB 48]